MERRIKAIAKGKRPSRTEALGAMLLVALLGLVTLTDAHSAGDWMADGGPIIEWEKTFGGDVDYEGRSVQQTSDGGYIIAGFTRSEATGDSNALLIKTDSAGNVEWKRTFSGTVGL